MAKVKSFFKRLRENRSGNTLIIVATGLPALIGGAGFAVDTAQWYLWKRELQFAADQAAVAGAWARANGDVGTVYQTRADQEFGDALQITDVASPSHTATLADYGTGTDNTVLVTASMTRNLPFSQLLMKNDVTISVTSQALYEEGLTLPTCFLALDPTASQALKYNGGPTVHAPCGAGALSNSSTAVVVAGGSSPINAGWIVSRGGVDDYFDDPDNFGFTDPNTGVTVQPPEVRENYADLSDPYEGLTPPDNSTPRSMPSCEVGESTPASYSATETSVIYTEYRYYTGRNTSSASLNTSYSGARTPTTSTVVSAYSAANSPSDSTIGPTAGSWTRVQNGNPKTWEEPVVTTTVTYTNITYNEASASATVPTALPGTYSGFDPACAVVMSPGVYVIDGGTFKINGGTSVIGSGIMIVLKNGADISINGGADVNLTGMTKSELTAVGVTSEDAERMQNMLVFEDPGSGGSKKSKINGNADTILNGVFYMPNSELTFAGTASVTSACLMVAAGTVNISGTADVNNLCPATIDTNPNVATGEDRVRLIL